MEATVHVAAPAIAVLAAAADDNVAVAALRRRVWARYQVRCLVHARTPEHVRGACAARVLRVYLVLAMLHMLRVLRVCESVCVRVSDYLVLPAPMVF